MMPPPVGWLPHAWLSSCVCQLFAASLQVIREKKMMKQELGDILGMMFGGECLVARVGKLLSGTARHGISMASHWHGVAWHGLHGMSVRA